MAKGGCKRTRAGVSVPATLRKGARGVWARDPVFARLQRFLPRGHPSDRYSFPVALRPEAPPTVPPMTLLFLRRAFAPATSPLLPFSLAALLAGCGPAADSNEPDSDPNSDPAADAGVPADSAPGTDAGTPGPTPGTGADAGLPGPVDADAGPSEPALPPLFEGSFTGSSAWNGANVLYALVYRAPDAGGHDHVVRSPNFSGTLRYRVGDLSACSVNVTVPVGALVNDEDEMRAEVGLADVTSDWGWNLGGGRDAVRNNMLAEGQLDAAGHPNIRFVSTGCRGTASSTGTLQVDGNLTLKGVTRPVTWTVQFTANESRVVAEGELTIRQTEFGITPYAFTVFQNADAVDLRFEIRVDD